ncbi:UNVERIFIED_CONTAM: hypothetical protein FKN15_015693 [Acipenser sinensis]
MVWDDPEDGERPPTAFLALWRRCTAGIQELLNVAKENVPCDLWKSTPLVLKATAGLRLLPGEKAKQLLDKVKDIFQASPFLSREDCVSIMDGSDEVEEGNTLVSPCLASDYEEQWEHAEVVYTIKGQKAGEPLYESCYSKVEKMLYRKVKKAEEAKDMDFYAFSYYYDRAVDIGIIDEKTDGNIKVEDYEAAAKKVCKSMETDQGKNPFLCLDLTYIAALLQELGFPKDKVFKWCTGTSLKHYSAGFIRLYEATLNTIIQGDDTNLLAIAIVSGFEKLENWQPYNNAKNNPFS